MTSCLIFHGPQLVSGERDATCKQCWICSKAKAALVSQCEYSWVKSAVFYKSLLCLETVGFGIWGTRSSSCSQQTENSLQMVSKLNFALLSFLLQS